MTPERREELIAEKARRIAEGGWSSIYSFVSSHIEDWELDDEDEDDDQYLADPDILK